MKGKRDTVLQTIKDERYLVRRGTLRLGEVIHSGGQWYYISSVVAEKTIDLLVCRRQKLRGQNWSRDGADNILTFRQLILNGHWKSYWQQRQAA